MKVVPRTAGPASANLQGRKPREGIRWWCGVRYGDLSAAIAPPPISHSARGTQIPITHAAPPTYPFPRFPPLEVCGRRPRCARHHLHGAGIRKPSQRRKSPLLFDHLVATGEHLAAMVIRAARLAAILLRIARGLQHADKAARL